MNKHQIGKFKIESCTLPVPDDLQAPSLPASSYDRLSVAYGLAFDRDDIGQVFEAPDIEKEESLVVRSS